MTIIVGIAGGSGSGKSTVARRLNAKLGRGQSAAIAFDNYYHSLDHLDEADRAAVNFDHPDALDDRLLLEHLRELRNGNAVEVPEYCFVTHTRNSTTNRLNPKRYILVEGVLLFAHEELRNEFNVKIFVDATEEKRLERRIRRDCRDRGSQ